MLGRKTPGGSTFCSLEVHWADPCTDRRKKYSVRALKRGLRGGTQPVVQHGADEMRGDTCQPDLTDSVTKNLDDEPIVQRW